MRGFMVGLAVSVAFIIGCVASQHVIPDVRADRGTSKWQCFRVSEMDDLDDAYDWSGALATTNALNEVAPHTPTGTVITPMWKDKVGLICVK